MAPPVYYQALDGVRVLACVYVIFLHVGFVISFAAAPGSPAMAEWNSSLPMRLIALGAFSVDVFFLLSGFLLTDHVLLSPRQVPSYMHLLIHRLVRILPALWCATLFGEWFGERPHDRIWEWLLLSNYWGYLPSHLAPMPFILGQMWSACVDWHVYILLGAFLLWLRRSESRKQRSLLFLFGLLLLSLIIRAAQYDSTHHNINALREMRDYPVSLCDPAAVSFLEKHYSIRLPVTSNPAADRNRIMPYLAHLYYPSHARFGPFVIGAILAVLVSKAKGLDASHGRKYSLWTYWFVRWPLRILASLVFGVLVAPPDPARPPEPVLWVVSVCLNHLLATSVAIWIYGALVPRDHPWYLPIWHAVLTSPIWPRLSALTYGVYLFHFRYLYYSIFVIFREDFEAGRANLWVFGKVFLVTAVCAFATAAGLQTLVEQPIRTLAGRWLAAGEKGKQRREDAAHGAQHAEKKA